MIGLDTNVLVRYITQDDPSQAAGATRLIEGHCSGDSPGWISSIVLCELVWVLRRAYRYQKADVLAVLDQLLITLELKVEDEEIARLAVDAYKTGGADFSDYLILLSNTAAGCETTYSFDGRLARHPAAEVPR
jgi:predicted nucleic-acid-binding protein